MDYDTPMVAEVAPAPADRDRRIGASGRPGPLASSAQVALVLAAWSAFTWLGWTGYAGSDDFIYANYAAKLSWLPRNHWEFRVPYVAMLRASFAAFGPSEFAACLPTLLASAMIAGSVAWFVGWPRSLDRRGLWAVLLACTLPLDAARSYPGAPYVAAGFLAVGAVCLLKRRGRTQYLGSAFLAVGFLTHEVSFFYVAILCLAALALDPRRYWRPVLACVVISGLLVAAECAAYGLLTGRPMIRYSNAAEVTERISDLEDRFGGSTLRFFTWPVEVLVFCKQWGFDLIALLVAGILAWRRLDVTQRILFLATIGLWLWLGYGTQVPWAYKPRTRAFHYYYPLTLGIASLLPFALEAALGGRARPARALVAGLVLVHGICLAAGGRWGQNVDVSRDLLAYARSRPGRVYLTDARSLGEMYVLNGFRRPVNVVAPREPSVMMAPARPGSIGRGDGEDGRISGPGPSRPLDEVDGVLINLERIKDETEGRFLGELRRHPDPRERISPVRLRPLWAPLDAVLGVKDFMIRSLGGEAIEFGAPRPGTPEVTRPGAGARASTGT